MGLIRVRTFGAADGLASGVPANTEEAQYSLTWPLACAVARGRFTVADVLGNFDDPAAGLLLERIRIEIDPQLDAAFPARRLSAVDIELADGTVLSAGPLEAPGEPEDPNLGGIVADKFAASSTRGETSSPLRPTGVSPSWTLPELLTLMCQSILAAALPELELDDVTLFYEQSGDGPDIVWLAGGRQSRIQLAALPDPGVRRSLPEHDLRCARRRRDPLEHTAAVVHRRARSRRRGADRAGVHSAGRPRRPLDGVADIGAARARPPGLVRCAVVMGTCVRKTGFIREWEEAEIAFRRRRRRFRRRSRRRTTRCSTSPPRRSATTPHGISSNRRSPPTSPIVTGRCWPPSGRPALTTTPLTCSRDHRADPRRRLLAGRADPTATRS